MLLPIMATFKSAFASLFGLVGIYSLAVASGWYANNAWFDIPMHFGGGFAMALLALAIWQAGIQKITFQKSVNPYGKLFIYAVWIIGFVGLIGIAWEWHEYLLDELAMAVTSDHTLVQSSIGDTMADFFFDLMGGLLAFVLFRERGE